MTDRPGSVPDPDEVTPDEVGAADPAADADLRRLLHDLPEVEPPDGFFDDLIRRRRRRARAIAAGGLAAAGLVGALVVSHANGVWGEADPPMAELLGRHAQVVDGDPEMLRGAMEGDEVPAPYAAPEALAGMRLRMALRHPDDVVQVFYTSDGRTVSVFEQVGDLDLEAMDVEMVPLDVAGVRAWQVGEDQVVVLRRDVVYVLVGDMADEELDDVVADLPDARPMGLVRRVRDAMDDLVDAFGFN